MIARMARERDVDDALETATRHAREAEEEFVEQPPHSAVARERAATVEHFAEDLNLLAGDVVDRVAEGDGVHRRQGGL